ncbi:putative ubiquitin conjugating enzyme [Aspergillus ibericus CBS 121593]|uniref:UBC core domain-containing protein n=1 Tax=Aspergillus ibericus CBS 121593 TaxID=1448316 RepID=A0A395HA66_9EURO|nr:hypothetical protein BO80DRAFT_499765 [Aspergillus ibericus CBS 121593]RAL04469.1 hypothetical protein BO80DRAFT_499765 [Aspergillus ibericus CBS 121593]
MPRHNFDEDLSEVSLSGRFPGLSHIQAGNDDTFIFTYLPPSIDQFLACTSPRDSRPLQFNVHLDVTKYPTSHSYFVFSASDNISDEISAVLETVQEKFKRYSLETFLKDFCHDIDQAVLKEESADPDSDEESDLNCDDEEANGDFDSSYDDQDVDDGFGSNYNDEDLDWDGFIDAPVISRSTDRKQLRADLRAAKSVGFKVGYLGELEGPLVVSISCRIAKLGISEDAMEMWNVSPEQFLVVLLRYPRGYRGLSQILARQGGPSPVQMHVGLCDTYKPTVLSVPDVARPAILHDIFCPSASDSKPKSAMKSSFITEPVETVLNDRFLSFIRNRLQHGFSWTGAELYHDHYQVKMLESKDVSSREYCVSEKWSHSTPSFVKGDQLLGAKNSSQLSLPLITMQYALRRFVKCTEFCLNCHCKVDAGFEALKPYVCSSPLCLYQYMQLGMGPRLEWEIVSQPYVVDMLVSFAYARASAGELTDFPTGLDLKVPWEFPDGSGLRAWTATWDTDKSVLSTQAEHDLKVGEWVAIRDSDDSFTSFRSPSLCCEVLSIHGNSLIQLSQPIAIGFGDKNAGRPPWKNVRFMPYRVKVDYLKGDIKQQAIMALLNTLPDVFLMKSFVTSGARPGQNISLQSWKGRICQSALYVLRWIVASNQSCIVHDDDPEHQVTGMHNYMQFRLAQGSPDKEARFVQAVKASASGNFPTIFAWHGSPVHNWHSILREGLNFNKQLHGRAYGDGVYMAKGINTSSGYSNATVPLSNWPQSTLDIMTAISLNEVVNAPHAFRCTAPFYVVAQLDWIQPRYLFISGKHLASQGIRTFKPSKVYSQDPHHACLGTNNSPVSIPISALSSRHNRADTPASTHVRKKRKVSMGGPAPGGSDPSDDCASVATLIDDLRLLESDLEDDACEPDCVIVERKARSDPVPQTDFRPGTLQTGSLQLLGLPSYATTTATQSLQRHLQAILKVQDREPLHELGWYVDGTLISTVYQWIVEFHSFDPSLPLAQDLKHNKLTSIVMEIRFPPQFPMSPPFIRVIRPHFTPFMQHGGGHVTAGGAMCMELLTSSGWLPTISMESVLLQVRLALCSTDPYPARLQNGSGNYPFSESVSAYRRACQTHGWKVPDDFNRIQDA